VRRATRTAALLAAAAVATSGAAAYAWGSTGHHLVSRAGALAFPASLPEFVRTSAAVDEIADLSVEADRSKGSGNPHDADADPGHFVDLSDDQTVNGAVRLEALPHSREAYDTALRASGTDEFKMGYLPYSIVDGWQQIAKDFAYWRADSAALKTGLTPPDRTFFERDRQLHELLTVRDIGVWSHYVGDASQPMHVSIHYNGWGPYPNPENFTAAHIHAPFEGEFVRDHATLDAVRADIPPYVPCNCTVETYVANYLKATQSQIVPLYTMASAGQLLDGSPKSVAFVDARLAAGAAALRDLVVMAWDASANLTVGYPPLRVADIESGAVTITAKSFGGD
jgi:hypothetical protein